MTSSGFPGHLEFVKVLRSIQVLVAGLILSTPYSGGFLILKCPTTMTGTMRDIKDVTTPSHPLVVCGTAYLEQEKLGVIQDWQKPARIPRWLQILHPPRSRKVQ